MPRIITALKAKRGQARAFNAIVDVRLRRRHKEIYWEYIGR